MNVILILTDNYPYKFSATNIKTEFIARGLEKLGCTAAIVDVPYGTTGIKEVTWGTTNNGVKYVQLPETGMNVKNAWHNLSLYDEVLKKLYVHDDKNFVLFGFFFFPFFLKICKSATKLGYKKLMLYHEWNIGTSHPSFFSAIEDYIMTYSFGFFLDGIIPISHFLKEKCKMFHKPQMILPIMAEFIENIDMPDIQNHFSFCANVNYLLRNKIILQAFDAIHEEIEDSKLILVLFGKEDEIENLKKYIKTLKSYTHIEIKSKIPQSELMHIYKSSIGLIIPLDSNNIADKARFSQKIAEYLSCSRPVITNNVGEIPYYLTHNKNVVIADYSSIGFANAMKYLMNNKEIANSIGKQGFIDGKEMFGLNSNCNNLINFLKTLS